MRTWLSLCLAALLAACASAPAPVAEREARFFHDASFKPSSERIRAEDVFALSPDMRRYVDNEIERQARVRGRQLALVDALYYRDHLKLDYDTEQTRNAAQAFAARSGNCLSLVIMTAAFAKELGLPVFYQKVFVDDEWARSGDIYLAIGHVNLTLGRRVTDGGGFGYRVGRKPPESEGMTIDFLPPEDIRAMRSREIGEEIIVAMYMNNRSVEALARGQVDDAYWWAREAVVQAPDYLVPYNTLGAVYRRHGETQAAADVLRYVLQREPSNIQSTSNLIAVLTDLGNTEEAARLANRLREMDPDPAFSHFHKGMAAIKEGDMKTARDELSREVKRAPDYHEFHFWLAVAYFNLGDIEAARVHMTAAMKNSTTRRDYDLYAAKLAHLNKAQ